MAPSLCELSQGSKEAGERLLLEKSLKMLMSWIAQSNILHVYETKLIALKDPVSVDWKKMALTV